MSQIKLSQKSLGLLKDRPDLIKKVANCMEVSYNTIIDWMNQNSPMLMMYKCYSLIQKELLLTDKEMFE